LITFVALRYIINSHVRLAFRSIGQNIEATRANTMEPTPYLVLKFTVSCAFADWLSGFYAHCCGILIPDFMNTSHTIEVLAAAHHGGRGSLWGRALAAFPLIFFRQWSAPAWLISTISIS